MEFEISGRITGLDKSVARAPGDTGKNYGQPEFYRSVVRGLPNFSGEKRLKLKSTCTLPL